MIKEHSDIPENAWYVTPGDPTQQFVIKTEVVEPTKDDQLFIYLFILLSVPMTNYLIFHINSYS